ncbi:gamma-glutamyltransferase [Rhodobacteraceae bacterium NNCM2]|nr:gamma-glutamyltransferase [Coraliihabitans acroporae]
MRDLELPGRSPAYGMKAMAATSHTLSTQTAIDILRKGGNAMDAAIAACAVQCVVEPGSTGIGGDNFCLYSPAGGDLVAFNGSGKAPTGATCEYFASEGITELQRQTPHSCVVPGAVDAWCRLNADHGRLPLKDLLAPAIDYATNGYPVSSRVSADWAGAVELMKAEPTMARIFLPGGEAPKMGAMHKQPELGATMQAIADGGRDAFYTGEIAEDMVGYLRGLGGLHTMEDFANVSGDYVTPISADFRGHTVWQCPPNGQGMIALLMLNIMSGIETGDGPISTARIHAELEACRLAYTSRNMYLADPAYAEVDVETLLSAEYADKLRAQIDSAKARDPMPDPDLVRHKDTVYISVVDEEGNACSFINTLFWGWGSGLCAPKSGVVFTNRAEGFSLDPASPNRIEPGKRPLHTIIPGMVTKAGRTVMPYGVMGGEYQAMGHMQFLTRMFDYGMDIQEAMDAPRFMADPFTGEVEMEDTVPAAIRAELGAMGHRIAKPAKPIGGSQGVWIDEASDIRIGGSDPRKDGCAIGY